MSDEAPANVTELPTKSLTDTILEADDSTEELVPVPEWGEGVEILVISMSSDERSDILRDAIDVNTGRVNFREVFPDLVIATAHHPETRERLFTEKHRKKLGTKNAALLDRVAAVAMRVSALTDLGGAIAGKG